MVFGKKWWYSGKSVYYSGKSSCIRAKVVVFGQSGCTRAKVWYSGKGGCIRAEVAKVVVFHKSVVFGQKWFREKVVVFWLKWLYWGRSSGKSGCIPKSGAMWYSCKSGCIRAEVVVFGKNAKVVLFRGFIRAKWLHSGNNGCIRAKVVFVVIFWQSDCNRAKVVLLGQKWWYSGKSGCMRAEVVVLG